MTATVGTDWVTVVSLRRASLALRLQMPLTTTKVAASATIKAASASPRRETLPVGGGDSGNMRGSVVTGGRGLAVVAVNDAEHDGDEDQGGDCSEDQAA